MDSTTAESFERYRPLLFSIAYQMLGSVMEAEDVVQDTFVRYQASEHEGIRSLKAFLTTITTRLCLDRLKSARYQRETYVGPWLPEPLVTEETPLDIVKRNEAVSMAFLVLLEQLSPLERAIYLLREVFDYPYAEIAPIVGKSEANCRQYYRNAKRYLVERRPRFQPDPAAQRKLIDRFLGTLVEGDMDGLLDVLAEDITLWSDGGGKVAAARRPLHGREAVARLLMSSQRLRPAGLSVLVKEINGSLSLVLQVPDGVIGVMNFLGDEAQIHEIRVVWNPDKLRHLQ